ELPESFQKVDAAHPRQPDIREHDVGLQALEELEGLLAGARDLGLVPVIREKRLGRPGERLLVVDDEDGGAVHASWRAGAEDGAGAALASPALGSQIRTVVPRPTTLLMLSRPPVSST